MLRLLTSSLRPFFFFLFFYLFFFLAVLDLTYLAYAFTPFRSNPSNPFVERAGCSGSQPADFVRTQLSAKQTLIRNRFCPDRSLISHSVFTGTQSILCHQCAFHNIHKQWPGRKRSSQVGSLPTTPPLPPSSLCLDNSRHIYSMKAEIQNGGLHPTVGGVGRRWEWSNLTRPFTNNLETYKSCSVKEGQNRKTTHLIYEYEQ